VADVPKTEEDDMRVGIGNRRISAIFTYAIEQDAFPRFSFALKELRKLDR
jgi:hypothetical protein